LDNVHTIIKFTTINIVENKISAYKQDLSREDINTAKQILRLKTEIDLSNVGYSYRDSVLIRKKILKKYLRYYENIFHCNREIKTKIKSELPEFYKRIMISRYTRLNEHLKSL
jgi:hypothetical protein